jgi:hypothetical protein
VQQTLWIVDNFARRLTAHAEKSFAVGICLVTGDIDQSVVFDLGQHPTERRMAVHGTHGVDRARL